MKTLKKQVTQFLITQNVWIIVMVLIIIAFQWVMTFRYFRSELAIDGPMYVYINSYKWLLFIKFAIALILFFIPALIFSLYRDRLKSRLTKVWYYSIWVFAFIMCPYLIGESGLTRLVCPVPMEPEIIWMISIVILGLDFLTSADWLNGFHFDFSKWRQKISIEWIVIIIYIILALQMAYKYQTTDLERQMSFLMKSVQVLILYFIMYLFYLVHHYYLVNVIYKVRGLVFYLFTLLGTFMIFYIPILLVYFYFPVFESYTHYITGQHWIGDQAPSAFWALSSNVSKILFFPAIPLTILIQWLQQDNRIQALQKENLDTELNLLKQQINPHFFFNTLNNVYSMSLTKDEKTPESILQLSDLMRYVIYKGQEKTVTLQEEINYIQDYLDLQKMRLSQKFDLRFEQDLLDPSTPITPLLFIILIENAFKHGIEGAENDSFLHIAMRQHDQELTLSVANSVNEGTSPDQGGLGLANLRRRLALLYPDRHDLSIESTSESYTTKLTIDLTTPSNKL